MSDSFNLRTLLLLTCCFGPAAAQAAIIDLSATLEPGQEVPPTASTGSGTGDVTFDDVTNMLSWDVTFSGLTTPVIGAHFHGPAEPGENAGIQVDIGAASGLSSPMMGSATISDSQESELLSGLWYINIHTETYPDGEIRGQVEAQAQVIPVPAAAWLLLGGLAGLWSFGRRR